MHRKSALLADSDVIPTHICILGLDDINDEVAYIKTLAIFVEETAP